MPKRLRDWQIDEAGLKGKTVPIPHGTPKRKGGFWRQPPISPVKQLDKLTMQFDKGTTKFKRRKKRLV